MNMLPAAWGQITVQLSFFAYIGMLLPQLLYNLRRKSVHGLSWLMHFILFCGCICDAGYGLGRLMPWQYYSITIFNIFVLSIQHFQFYIYSRRALPRFYFAATIFLSFLLICVAASLRNKAANQDLFLGFGYVGTTAWLLNSLPQITVNWRLQSTAGVSFLFVVIGLLAMLCDTVSAYSLGWGLPNKIGGPISVTCQAVLLFQFWRYRKGSATPAAELTSP